MAISLMQSDSNVAHGVNVYVMDERADKEKLPISCKPGSQAICTEDGSVYILNNSREWKEI